MTTPPSDPLATRQESDSLGTIAVPARHLWGAQTQRSLQNFAIGDQRMPLSLVYALAQIKKAAALENAERGTLATPLAQAIASAADEILAGQWDDEFPLVIWQTGSGTQTNMNVNEVIAARANQLLGAEAGAKSPVHPNDHVNLSQSSNDAFPTAMSMAAVAACEDWLLPALGQLHGALSAAAARWANIVKIGRTHLMDAVPLTLGDEAGAWAAQVARGRTALVHTLEGLRELAMGATAVGTGLNAPAGWADALARRLSQATGRRFHTADNKFEALASHDAFVHASGALNGVATGLFKIASDIRLLASGPRAGIGELRLPALEPGSSIMPGKVNPTQIEAVTMVCARVIGNHVTISFAGSQGQLQLNACKPVIIAAFLESVRLLSDAARSFSENAIAGLIADEGRIAALVQQSLMLVTALTPRLGYDRAAQVAKHAVVRGGSLKEAAVELGFLTAAEFDLLVVPANMARPSR